MTKLSVYTVKGTKKKQGIVLPKEYGEKANLDLLAQAVRVYENRFHAQNAKTKRRGEVEASTRKIYAQKGTGRARHGALSAPIFVGGGKAHGPDGRSRTLKLPKKMAQKALLVALSIKAENGKLIVVEGLDSLNKTKDAAKLLGKILKSIKKRKSRNIVVALCKDNLKNSIYLRNIEGVTVELFSDLNAYKVYKAGVLVVDKNIFEKSKSKASRSGKK